MFKGKHFPTANIAFSTIFAELCKNGIETGNGTKRLYNVGFYITNPLDRDITVEWRKWSKSYAEREWEWYLSKNRSVEELKKFAPIWDKMHNGDNIVNSNYGYLWSENGQLEKTIEQLKKDPLTRRAWITIFDGKNKDEFSKDTPCTLSIGFTIEDNKLCMNVFMRSNDIWFGFCNDQYCFSKLQELVANELGLPVGWYYHHAADMHVYEKHYDADKKFYINQHQIRMVEVKDPINPSHYKQYPIEAIDMMIAIFGKEAVRQYCLITAFKYRMRLGHKDAVDQELKKEKWYLDKAEELK